MSGYLRLQELIKEKAGIVFTKDLIEYNIAREYIRLAVKERLLKPLERGVYLASGVFADEMFILQNKYPKVVFSHGTAAYLLGFTTRDPLVLEVTAVKGYNVTPIKKRAVDVHLAKGILKSDCVETKTMFDRTVVCFCIEKTICDLCSNRYGADKAVFVEIIKAYTASKDKNLTKLMKYAINQKVDNTIRKYMEVLV